MNSGDGCSPPPGMAGLSLQVRVRIDGDTSELSPVDFQRISIIFFLSLNDPAVIEYTYTPLESFPASHEIVYTPGSFTSLTSVDTSCPSTSYTLRTVSSRLAIENLKLVTGLNGLGKF